MLGLARGHHAAALAAWAGPKRAAAIATTAAGIGRRAGAAAGAAAAAASTTPPIAAAARRRAPAVAAAAARGDDDQGRPPSEQEGEPSGPTPIREQLARYGLGAFAAYGILSNCNAGVLIVVSWMAVVNQLGVTPLDPSAAGYFAASYAALYLTSNLLRPVRLSLAIGAAPFFNRFLDGVQRRLRLARPVAFGLLLLLIATGTITTIALALAALGGFPQGIPSPAGLEELIKGLKEGVRAAKQQAAAAGG